MAQILIKGESVYACDVCNRKIRVLTSRDGIDVVQRCTITYNCHGKLHRVTNTEDINTTPAFPVEVAGVQDWFQRKVEYTHVQPIKSTRWLIKHNLANKPLVYAYVSMQTEASASYPYSYPVVGAVWYKTASGVDVNNLLHPSAAGLYVFDGARWTTPNDVIPVQMQGQHIFEYLKLVKPKNMQIIDANSTLLEFDTPCSGTAQCVALASQNTLAGRRQTVASDSVFKLTNNGEITIATTAAASLITTVITFKSAVLRDGVNAVFGDVDNIASVASPWVGVRRVFVNNKTLYVRSFNIANTPPVPGIMTSGNVNPIQAEFTFSNFGNKLYENYILLGNSPYATVDRIYDRIIDIGALSRTSPEIYYSNGEVYVKSSVIQNVYPVIKSVD